MTAAAALGRRRQADLVDELQVAGQLPQPPLGDVGLAAGDVALDELGLALQPFFFLIVEPLGPLPGLLPLRNVSAVVALVGLQFGRIIAAAGNQLPHAVDDAIQEVAVVADDDQRPFPAAQRALQPLHGGDVQVVGRLVEDEQGWPLQQQAAQQHARLLAAAQVQQRRVPLAGREAQPQQHPLDVVLVLVATLALEAFLQRAVLRQ